MRLISMMKIMNRMMRIGGAMALLMTAAGCVNEEPAYVEPVEPETAEMGYLSLSEIGLYVVSDSDTDQSTEESSTAMLSRADDLTFDSTVGAYNGKEATTKEDYMVTIRSEKGDVVFHNTFDELKKQVNKDKGGLKVPVGQYTISATSNLSATGVPAVVQDSPSYAGKVDGVNVVKDETAQAGTIVCKLQNIKITVGVAADLYEQLAVLNPEAKPEEQMKIDAEVYYADSEIDWQVPAKWDWEAENPKPVYFPALKEDKTLHFRFRAKLEEGSEIEITRDISGVMEGQWRRVHVVPQYDTEGNVVFDVQVSAFVPDETITVNGENGGEGAGDGTAPAICWTELALDPSSGEPSIKWADGSELPESIAAASQPVTIAAPNGIERVGLTVRTTNPEFTADAAAMTKDDLCGVASNRQLTNYGIPFGAALKGQSSVSFGLDKILGQIRGYAGEYTFAFTVTDQKGSTCEQTLRFVSGGGSSAAGPTIEWTTDKATDKLFDDEGFNFNPDGSFEEKQGVEYVTMYDGMQIDIELAADPHFESIKVKITSDALTEDVLALANLSSEFDLCNLQDFVDSAGEVHTVEGQTTALTSNLGLIGKVNDDLKAESSAFFSITKFVSVMRELGANAKFQFALTVVDADGRSTTKYLRLQNPAE